MPSIVFRGTAVLPERLLPEAVVIVEGERIVAVGRAGDVALPASAEVIRGVLAGRPGPAARVVTANAAAALLAARKVHDLREGVARAAEAIGSGRAAATLEVLVGLSGGPGR